MLALYKCLAKERSTIYLLRLLEIRGEFYKCGPEIFIHSFQVVAGIERDLSLLPRRYAD